MRLEILKILLINYMETTKAGGINKTVREIAKNMSIRDNGVIIIQDNVANLSSEEYFENYKIIRVKSKISKYLYGLSPAMIFYIKKHLKKINPDIIHIHGYHSLLSAELIFYLKYFIKTEIPIVFSPHYDIACSSNCGKSFIRLYNLIVGKKLFLLVDGILANSNFEALVLKRTFKLSTEKIVIIPLGVDTIDLVPSIMNTGNSGNFLKLVYSGYLIKRKRVEYILLTLRSLIYDFNIKKINLKIIGEGPEKKKLKKLANYLKINDYITWENFLPREDFIKNIKNSNILILLSESEAFGIVVAEALAWGIPCIITNTTALTEYLDEPGCYGVNYPPDPKIVAEKILFVYNEKPSVGPFSNKIRTWDRVNEDYNQLYNQLIQNNV